MVERIKNKKGFTIIEIMVVIALIGILAAVLVPQFGGVKDKARDAGVLTNAKMVEVYVASIIDDFTKTTAIDGTDPGTGDMIAKINTYFGDAGSPLKNPYSGITDGDNVVVVETAGDDYRDGTAAVADGGIIYVVIDNDADNPLTAYINGFDVKGNEITNSQRKIVR
ncbi:MAG TPA: type II secretion system protein [Clostridia bacterium]|nr:type II secretion system protein [Clostridia bacterium]